MNTRQFECFTTVVKQNSFSKAAEKLFLTQSVVSYQIRSLEKEIGFPLFLRDRHPVQLTSGGEVFYKTIIEVTQSIEKSVELGRTWFNNTHSLLNINLVTFLDPMKIARFISRSQLLLPDLQINLMPYIMSGPKHQLLNPDIDIYVIYRDEVINNEDFQYIPLFVGQDYCWLSTNHPLASKSHIDAREIKDEEIILMENLQEYQISAHIYDELLRKNPNPKFRYVSDFENIAIALIISNSCVTLAPTDKSMMPIDGIKSIPYGNGYPINICVAWRKKDCSRNTKRCVDLIVDSFHEEQ
jgi:DNA-binding transcriptional LysR family regulator